MIDKVEMYCVNHPELRWLTKFEAISPNGRYTGTRFIFFDAGKSPNDSIECNCPGTMLRAMPGQGYENT